jgi:hypothetical protein
LHQDFTDCSALAQPLTGQDAAIFCLGVYTGGVPDPECVFRSKWATDSAGKWATDSGEQWATNSASKWATDSGGMWVHFSGMSGTVDSVTGMVAQ